MDPSRKCNRMGITVTIDKPPPGTPRRRHPPRPPLQHGKGRQGHENGHNSGLSSTTESEEEITTPSSRFAKYYVCDSELLEKILHCLGFDDLLKSRLVCHNWYKIIGESGLLWRNARMALTLRRLGTGDPGSGNYANTDLFKRFHCPNFSFYGADLREDLFRNFFIVHGLRIKHLAVRNCFISKSTFDLILLQCPNLEHLDISCVSRTVSLCEMLFPRDLSFGLNLSKLKTLVLKRLDSYSNTKEAVSNSSFSNQSSKLFAFPVDPMSENLDGENLSPIFVEQLLESCASLQEIKMAGWSGPTVYNLVTFINSRPQFCSLKRLVLDDVTGKLDESVLFPLCTKAKHLQLRELSLSLKEPMIFVSVLEQKRSQMLDSVLELILECHRETLETLSLVNLPVTANIFRGPFPSLVSLRLLNTWVDDIDRLLLSMPKLDTIDYQLMERKMKGKSCSLLKNGYNFAQFCQCSTIDFVFLVTFVVVVFLVALVALVFQFETFGQWFIAIGFVILAAICLADYFQQYPEEEE